MQIPICIGVCLKISNDACFRNMLLDSLSFLCKLLCNGAAMGKMPAAAVTKDTAAGSDSSVLSVLVCQMSADNTPMQKSSVLP